MDCFEADHVNEEFHRQREKARLPLCFNLKFIIYFFSSQINEYDWRDDRAIIAEKNSI